MSKSLVLYFSPQNHSKHYAELVAKKLNADMHEIKPAILYTEHDLYWPDSSTRATVEQKTMHDGRVDIVEDLPSTANYDNIIIAAPVWWGIPPRLIATVIESS